MKTSLIIICCSAMAAVAGPNELPARIHPVVPARPAHIVIKPIPRPPLPPARLPVIPKGGTAVLNGTGIGNRGGKK